MTTVGERCREVVRTGLAIAVALCVLAATAGAAQATATGSLRVTVASAANGKVLVLTEVGLYAPGQVGQRAPTGLDGSVMFYTLVPGAYEVVVNAPGYVEYIRHGIIVGAGKTTTLAVRLERTKRMNAGLRTIAQVNSTQKVAASATSTTSKNPEAQLTGSMLDALRTLPSVIIANSGFSQYPSLGGHLPSETGITINGVPVAGYGGSPDLQSFNLNLFDSVGIDTGGAGGAAGGTVNFETRDPTLDWLGFVDNAQGSYGNAAYTLGEEGTLGRMGVSFAYAGRDRGSPLDGLRFTDSSGLDYVHDALAASSGGAAKIRYPFSLNDVLFGSFVTMRSETPFVCTTFTGPVPCGYGPTNRQYQTLSSAQLRDDIESGRWAGTVTVYGNRTTTDVDQSGRYVGGIHLPQSSVAQSNANGLIVDGSANVGELHSVHFKLTAENSATSSGGGAFGTIVPAIAVGYSYETASLAGEIYSSRHFSSNASLGVASSGGRPHGNGIVGFSYALSNVEHLSLAYGVGMLSLPTASYGGIADPPSLQYNCDAHNAVGSGPSSASSDSTTTQTTLGWQRSGRIFSIDASFSHQVQFNAPIQAIVGAGALSSTFFTPAYLTGVAQGYAAACGSAAPPLTTAGLFYSVGAIAPRATYDNARFAVHYAPNRKLAFDLTYGLTLARAATGIGPAFSRNSTLIPGTQLPQTPLHTLSFNGAGSVGRSGITALFDANFVGANNPNYLPAYLTVDAGVRFPLKRSGSLTVSFLNLTNAHAGIFASSIGAVPLPMGAGSFATIAEPLTPHAIEASWHVPIGPDVDLAASPIQCGANCYGFTEYPLPAKPPRDPFDINRSSGLCGPEALPNARQYLGIVQSYAERIEAVKAQSGAYPAVFPTGGSDGLVLYYRQSGNGFAILVAIQKGMSMSARLPILKPLLGCARIATADFQHAHDLGLYMPTYDENHDLSPVILYSPRVGFYLSHFSVDFTMPDYLPMPAAPPSDPFAIAAACPQTLRPAAQAFIALIEPYVTATYAHPETPPHPPSEFRIVPHQAKGGLWLEIRSEGEFSQQIMPCFNIAGVSSDDLQKLGLDGTFPFSIDFAPRLGFYNRR